MATKVHHQPEFVGAQQFLAMLDFLRNADRYAAKYKEINDAREHLNKMLEGKLALDQIEAAKTAAEKDRERAAIELASAMKRSDEIMHSATSAAQEIRATAEHEAREAVQAAQAEAAHIVEQERLALADAEDREAEATAALNAAVAREQAAAERIEAAETAERLAVVSRQRFEERYAALRGALAAAE